VCDFTGDGGVPSAAFVNTAARSGLAIDAAGNVIFSDTNNNRIRAIYPPSTDVDGDGHLNVADNCSSVANADQANTDAATLLTPGGSPDDTIVRSDALGDACDADDDNDGLADDAESGVPCAAASAPTLPLVQDTDGDRTIDGAECELGSDPNDSNSRPPTAGRGEPGICPEDPALDDDGDRLLNSFEMTIATDVCDSDSDDDGLSDGAEYRGYGSSPLSKTSDPDDLPDCREMGDVNGNENVNAQDLGLVAFQFGRQDRPVQDVDKNGTINAADLGAVASVFFNSALCLVPVG
jgi:hypothetical protein